MTPQNNLSSSAVNFFLLADGFHRFRQMNIFPMILHEWDI